MATGDDRITIGYKAVMAQLYKDGIDRRVSVAPMMDWTDRHCRVFHRMIAPHAFLFTEMVTAEAVLHGDLDRLLGHCVDEHPLALQLGGSQPDRLAAATRMASEYVAEISGSKGDGAADARSAGFAEINLNVGCPSDRVQSGRFGACLMAEPELVADCMRAMAEATDLPVTVKCRIGIDDMDEEAGLDRFVDIVSDAGVSIFYLHARKAWLKGLSPKENRDIPPLDYDRARRLAARRSDLAIHLNGGIVTAESAIDEQASFAGVMIGRAAYKTPMILADISAKLFDMPVCERRAIADQMADYADEKAANGTPLHTITRHMLGLYTGQRGAKHWRRRLGEEARLAASESSGFAKAGDLIRETAAQCETLAQQWAA
jgi:tRNA-dihydrouridine synthase A